MNVVADTHEHFLVMGNPDHFFESLNQASLPLAETYRSVASAFNHNLRAAWASLSLPVTLAACAVQDTYFQMIRIEEALRTLQLPHFETKDDADKEAELNALKVMQEFTNSSDGKETLAKKAAQFLSELRKAPAVDSGAAELLGQGVVLIWGALEVFARDFFVALLNAEPDRCKSLAQSLDTKRRFDLKAIPLELLFSHGYDLTSKMGTLLADVHDLSDLPSIKKVFTVLFPSNSGLPQVLGHKDLWILNQRRHLIVHRRGVIDREYLEKSGETATIGELLTVTPDEIKIYFGRVRDAGVAVIEALAEQQKTQF